MNNAHEATPMIILIEDLRIMAAHPGLRGVVDIIYFEISPSAQCLSVLSHNLGIIIFIYKNKGKIILGVRR